MFLSCVFTLPSHALSDSCCTSCLCTCLCKVFSCMYLDTCFAKLVSGIFLTCMLVSSQFLTLIPVAKTVISLFPSCISVTTSTQHISYLDLYWQACVLLAGLCLSFTQVSIAKPVPSIFLTWISGVNRHLFYLCVRCQPYVQYISHLYICCQPFGRHISYLNISSQAYIQPSYFQEICC